ncbi:MAG: hypothetical protein RLZZ234_198 [Candidatus Parcubacteria bacterium]|jgi:Ca2+-binding RTX toxin-like protein
MDTLNEDFFVFTHVGTAGYDLMVGIPGAHNIFVAGDGNDVVSAYGGTNTVVAEGGDDIVVLASGYNHVVDGGFGNDTIFLQDTWGQTSVYGGTGNDTITMAGGSDWFATLFANGGSGNDSVYGGSGNDTISGGAGNDTITAGAGNDSIAGGADQDTLRGGLGDDFISGDAGNDSIAGGLGNDHLYGGTGSDHLSGSGGKDWLDGAAGNDTLYGGRLEDIFVFQDFIHGERDVVADYKSGEDVILIGYDDYQVRQVGAHVLIEVESATSTASVLVLNASVAGVHVEDMFWGKG